MAPEERKAGPFSSGNDATSFLRKRPSTRNSHGVLQRLLIIFCLLGLTAVGVNVKFLLDTRAEMNRQIEAGPGGTAERTAGNREDVSATLPAAANRLAVLLGITVICFGCVVYLFLRRVVIPFNLATRTARDLSRGNLSVSVRSNPHGEAGELGEALNDLAANFQEVLLLMGTTVGNSFSAIERIEKALEAEHPACNGEIGKQLEKVKKDLVQLRSLVHEFDFYQTRFDGQKVVSENTGREG
ncbi:MAG: HAMP domain-containing protein [Pseudomonadota bacterium]